MRKRTKWFSITKDDCRWIAKRGSGNGGQKKQKTSSAIQCFHDPSGAMGESEDARDQILNRRTAFKRMVESPEFQSWLKLKIDAGLGKVEIEEADEAGNTVKRKLRLDEV
jgi:hypothetical protein